MNKFIKTGLLLQIPNVLIVSVFLLILIVSKVNWTGIIDNLIWIILGTLFAIVNLASLVLLFIGIGK